MTRYIALIAPLTLLAGCGGSGGGPTFITIPAEFTSAGDSDVVVELTSSGDTITLEKTAGQVAIGTDTAPDVGTFRTAVVSSADYSFAFVSVGDGSTAGGAVYADGATQTNGAFYERVGVTNMPTEGTATFTGDYLSVLVDATTQGTAALFGFQGDVTLNVDFETQMIDGTIEDREMIFVTGDPVSGSISTDDMTLVETTLTNAGAFAGGVTGGAFTIGAETSVVGASAAYEGLIAGTDADQSVGAVIVPHLYEGINYIEVGAFATGH